MELGVDPFARAAHRRLRRRRRRARRPAAAPTRACAPRSGRCYAAGAMPVVLGGDHSLSLRRRCRRSPTTTGRTATAWCTSTRTPTPAPTSTGNTNNHGTPFYLGVARGRRCAGANIVQIGLRGAWPFPDEFQWMRDQGFRWHTMDEIDERGLAAVLDDAIAHARAARAAHLPDGRHRRARPGLRARHRHARARRPDHPRAAAARCAAIASELDLVALDVVEVSPPYDHAGVTAMAGHRVVLEALSGMALRRSGRPARPERP